MDAANALFVISRPIFDVFYPASRHVNDVWAGSAKLTVGFALVN